MLSVRRSWIEGVSAKSAVDLDRRGCSRIHTLLRVAMVTRRHDVGLWRMRNISDGGMMMLTRVEVTKGERMSISLSDGIAIEGEAAWWDGERCGVAFDRPVDCATLLERLVADQKAPRYRPLRLPVRTRAVAYCEKGMHSVQLHNISQHGAGLSHDGCLTPGMNAMLHFPAGDDYRGVVRWAKDKRAGLFLTEPIPFARLESAMLF